MGVDVWRRGAWPVFTYSQDYIGALQAYLAAPFFALLNGDPLALRLATLLQTLLFLAVSYALARRLYSRSVALIALALLTFGSDYALKHELQAGVGAQDTLLFGALVIWLTVVRLRGGWTLTVRLALDAGIGLAIGLGLWGDFLFLPYVALAALALGYTALHVLARAPGGLGAPRLPCGGSRSTWPSCSAWRFWARPHWSWPTSPVMARHSAMSPRSPGCLALVPLQARWARDWHNSPGRLARRCS